MRETNQELRTPQELRTAAVPRQTARRAPVLYLADDDAELRQLVGLVLRADGYEVHESRDGTEFLEELSVYVRRGEWAGPLDLIISDDRMPGPSGLDVLERFREDSCETPMVVLTAFADDETIARAAHLGAVVLRKPVDMRTLQATVHDLAPID